MRAHRPSPVAAITDDQLRTAAGHAAAAHDLSLVVLFGSAATGERAHAEDLDIALLGDGPLDLVALTNAFTRALGTQAVDLVDLGRADPLLMMFVARDGIVLSERTASRFDEFVSLAARRYSCTSTTCSTTRSCWPRWVKPATCFRATSRRYSDFSRRRHERPPH
jgi:predicted nucleotidyltransferase